jgi:hypothetical protein
MDKVKVTGIVHIRLSNSNGIILDKCIHNTVTSVGKSHIASLLSSSPDDSMIAMAVGTGTPTTTALGSEAHRRNLRSRTSSGAVATYVCEYDIEDNFSGTLTEAGIFNSSSIGGTMLCSVVILPSIVKAVNDSLTITWTLTIS